MNAAQKQILVVDDERSVRDALQRTLVVHGYDVATAANGDEALQKFVGRRMDLVLLDWNISNENGGDVFQRLTAISPFLPVIVVTASPDQVSPMLRAGADAILEKPIDLPFLFSAIDFCLSETTESRASRKTQVVTSQGSESEIAQKPLIISLTRIQNCGQMSVQSFASAPGGCRTNKVVRI